MDPSDNTKSPNQEQFKLSSCASDLNLSKDVFNRC